MIENEQGGKAMSKDEALVATAQAPTTSHLDTTFEMSVQYIHERLNNNHASREALYQVLKFCETARPYREVDAQIATLPCMRNSLQTPHVLLDILMDAGGIDRIEVSESSTPKSRVLIDQPVGYLVHTTEAGRKVVADLAPIKRFNMLLSQSPDSHAEVYRMLLVLCEMPRTRHEIEEALVGNSALATPKKVYSSMFVSRLEEQGGITWDGAWRTTAEGRAMLD